MIGNHLIIRNALSFLTIMKDIEILATTLLQTNGRQQPELDAILLQLAAYYVTALRLDTK